MFFNNIIFFEMLKKGTGQYEKEVDVKLVSDNFKNIVFSKNCKFVNLSREKLFDSMIRNM